MIHFHSFFAHSSNRTPAERRSYINQPISYTPTTDYLSYGRDYWDNPKIPIGYNGYTYDGRYKQAAAAIKQYLNLSVPSNILEIGCSRGHLLVEFDELGFNISGVDVSTYALETCVPSLSNRLTYLDPSTTPLTGTYDVIICKDVLPHIATEKLPFLFLNINSVLASNGVLVAEIKTVESNTSRNLSKRFDPTQQSLFPRSLWVSFLTQYIQGHDCILGSSELF
mgnify:CR=1 FL=1